MEELSDSDSNNGNYPVYIIMLDSHYSDVISYTQIMKIVQLEITPLYIQVMITTDHSGN